MEHKLASWKAKYLSLRGHITLIKAALANLLVYFMYVSNYLMVVIKRIVNWNGYSYGKAEGKKTHLIKRSRVCKPNKVGF